MESTTGAGGFTHLFTQPWQAALEGHSPHTGNGARTLMSHTYFPQFCTQPRRGTHVRTYSTHTHCHTTQATVRPPRPAHAVAHSAAPARAQARQARTRAASTRSPARPRTRPDSHTPAFPVPACFSGNSALCSPPPRPEVLAVFLAALVSAPFLLALPAQELPPPPPHPAGDPGHPLPHRHSRGDSRPPLGPRIFPLAT